MLIYCKHCRCKTENLDEIVAQSAGRYFLKAVCAVCGSKKAARVKAPKEAEPVEPAITEDTDEVEQQ